ncbi:unnamed protein product [Ectocarpus fasciculatus]
MITPTSPEESSMLTQFPAMGVYEILFRFYRETGDRLGAEGTHPYAQGSPLTTAVPGGDYEIPTELKISSADLKYPQANGNMPLLMAIRDYYNHFYGCDISTENIAIFGGGRPALYTTLAFLKSQIKVLVEETEYSPYWDVLKLLEKDVEVIPSNPDNNFRPTLADYEAAAERCEEGSFILKSNPSNPTGVMTRGEELQRLVDFCEMPGHGGIIDEAYEYIQYPVIESAMKYVRDLDNSNLFVCSSATKGLQSPGARIGWVISSKKNTKLFRNFSSMASGGVSQLSQIFVAGLLDLERVTKIRESIGKFYAEQRTRYGEALKALGFELYSGDAGFYHWAKLPNNITCTEFNDRLFEHKAAILPGTMCDMFRRDLSECPQGHFIRFSFGPLPPESFEEDIDILSKCVY